MIEFPNPISSLVCNDLVYISLDADCFYCLGADGILEGGPYHCYDDYIVEVDKTLPYGNGPWVPACFGPADIGKTYQVRVTDSDSPFNKCWGNVKIEDKLAPVLDCPPGTLPCNAEVFPGSQQTLVGSAQTGNFVIPASGAVTVNFDYNGPSAPIEDLNITSFLTNHTWVGDIEASLRSPQGTTVQFFSRPGVPVPGGFGCAGDGLNVSFDDESVNPYALFENACGNLPAIAGEFQSLNPLSAFDGENPNGTWVLTVNDLAAPDGGTISSMGISIQQTGGADFPNGLVYLVNVFPTGIPQQYTVPAGSGVPQLENCSDVTLNYLDSEVPEDCASGLTVTISRKWTATDASGNSSTCIQIIELARPTLNDVVMPPDYDDIDADAFKCEDNTPYVDGFKNPTPAWIESLGLQGYPYVFGVAVGCNVNWEYHDYVIEVCDGTVKYRREWTVIDWCTGAGFVYDQILKVLDDQGPSIACPANLTVSTDPFTCCATINLPDVIVTDNCSHIVDISGMIVVRNQYTGVVINMVSIDGSLDDFPGNNWWNLDTLANFGVAPCLPIGNHTVTYVVEDDCGNTSSCNFNLTVRDYTPPVAACDETTTVAIGIDDPFDCYGPAGPPNQGPDRPRRLRICWCDLG